VKDQEEREGGESATWPLRRPPWLEAAVRWSWRRSTADGSVASTCRAIAITLLLAAIALVLCAILGYKYSLLLNGSVLLNSTGLVWVQFPFTDIFPVSFPLPFLSFYHLFSISFGSPCNTKCHKSKRSESAQEHASAVREGTSRGRHHLAELATTASSLAKRRTNVSG
jgi:hypothetical protein